MLPGAKRNGEKLFSAMKRNGILPETMATSLFGQKTLEMLQKKR